MARRMSDAGIFGARNEAVVLLSVLDGIRLIMAMLLCGTGLRHMECVRLRSQNLEVGGHALLVGQGKGDKDRVIMLAAAVMPTLRMRRDVKASMNCATGPQLRWPWCAAGRGGPGRQRHGGAIASAMGFVSEWGAEGESRPNLRERQCIRRHHRRERCCGYESLDAWVGVLLRTPKCGSAWRQQV
jgi:integrase